MRESFFNFATVDDKPNRESNEKQWRTLTYEELAAAADKAKDEAKKEAKEKGYIDTDMFENLRKDVCKERDLIAKQVLNGAWGTGREKENKLRKAGYNPVSIQKRADEMSKIKEYRVWIDACNPFSMHDAQTCGFIQGVAYVMCVEPCGTILQDIECFGAGSLLIVDTTEDRIRKFEKRVKKIVPFTIIIEEKKKG